MLSAACRFSLIDVVEVPLNVFNVSLLQREPQGEDRGKMVAYRERAVHEHCRGSETVCELLSRKMRCDILQSPEWQAHRSILSELRNEGDATRLHQSTLGGGSGDDFEPQET